MKAKLFAVVLLLTTFIIPAPATANDPGAWIKVDANGKAIGGAIVCTPDVCGDVNSSYARATLQAGERYVLQFKADPITGNVAGIPAPTDPNVELKVNTENNEWTKTTRTELKEPTTVVIDENSVTITAIETKERWNPTVVVTKPTPTVTPTPSPITTPPPAVETSTVTTETATVVSSGSVATETITATTSVEENTETENEPSTEIWNWLTMVTLYLEELWAWLATLVNQDNS
jgi:hypothetical protein